VLFRRALATSVLTALVTAWAAVAAVAATPASVKFQLRGHLQELGERPSLRVFESNAAYDTFRASLGDANLFPAASSLFMSFDTDRLVLYARGNDAGGRCLSRTVTAQDGTALTLNLQWEAGTCGAPITAHYPFLLLSLSRASADGSSWVPSGGRSVCATVGPDTDACATVGAAPSPAPSPSPPAGQTASPAPTIAATPTPPASPPRSASPTVQATTTPGATATASPPPAPTRTPAATSAGPIAVTAASPAPVAQVDAGPNYIYVAIIVGFVLLVVIAIVRSRTAS
jgi:hypothetical protein